MIYSSDIIEFFLTQKFLMNDNCLEIPTAQIGLNGREWLQGLECIAFLG
jgi:hypothetical protein